MDAVVSLTGHGGWPMASSSRPRASRSTAGRTTRPSRDTACPRSDGAPPRSPMPGTTVVTTSSATRARSRGVRRAIVPSREPPDVVSPHRRGPRAALVRSGVGRVRKRTEVPRHLGARAPSPPRRARACDEDAGRHGPRRHVRPRRRRLPPLLRRPRVARAALREDAVRRAPPPRLQRLGRHGNRPLPVVIEETVDCMLRELRLPEGRFALRTLTRTASRASSLAWTEQDDVPKELLHPFEGGRFILRADPDTRARLLADESSASNRCGTTRRSRGGPASPRCARRVRPVASTAMTTSRPPSRRQSSSLAGCPRGTAAAPHVAARAGQDASILEDYADVANGFYELASRPAGSRVETARPPRHRPPTPGASS